MTVLSALLIMAGDVELNPGPRGFRKCPKCEQQVPIKCKTSLTVDYLSTLANLKQKGLNGIRITMKPKKWKFWLREKNAEKFKIASMMNYDANSTWKLVTSRGRYKINLEEKKAASVARHKINPEKQKAASAVKYKINPRKRRQLL